MGDQDSRMSQTPETQIAESSTQSIGKADDLSLSVSQKDKAFEIRQILKNRRESWKGAEKNFEVEVVQEKSSAEGDDPLENAALSILDKIKKFEGQQSHGQKLARHSSQQDYKYGYGGQYGVENERFDKSAVGWDHWEELAMHESQRDGEIGYDGQFGLVRDRKNQFDTTLTVTEKVKRYSLGTVPKKTWKNEIKRGYSESQAVVDCINPIELNSEPANVTTFDKINHQYDSTTGIESHFQKYRPEESTANWTSEPLEIKLPKDFQLKPIEAIAQAYKPSPESLLPETLFRVALTDEDMFKLFQRVDSHSLRVSSRRQNSFKEIIWQLIYARNITNELEKARAIFMWLCTKDLNKMDFKNVEKGSPEEILMGIKNGKYSYAHIFLTLCRYASLKCKLITGYAKSVDYESGMKFIDRKFEHPWNAVLIDDVWGLIDCDWGSRHIFTKILENKLMRYNLQMFYFLPNPKHFIYGHFPYDKDWQLLQHPIVLEEFESLPVVKPRFFKYNLDFMTHKNAVITTTNPEIEIKLAFPSILKEQLLFMFQLTFADGRENYNEIPLSRYGRQEFDLKDNSCCFWIRTPISGAYDLTVFSKVYDIHEENENIMNNEYYETCGYRINSNISPNLALPYFPFCKNSRFGPTKSFTLYPIKFTNTNSTIYVDNGVVEIKFLLLKPHILMVSKLYGSEGEDDIQLTKSCIIQRLCGREEEILTCFLPKSGEYCLEIYANDSNKDDNLFHVVWQYFIVNKAASMVKGLPSIEPGYLGAFEPKFSDYGLSAISHIDPFIIDGTGNLCIQLRTIQEMPVNMIAQLIYCSNDNSEMCPNSILQSFQDLNVFFHIRFPYEGFFKLQIFGSPDSENNESLPNIFNYLIQSTKSSQHKLGFPQQFRQWKKRCYLYEPLDGVLGTNEKPENIKFRMVVKEAKLVVVIINELFTILEKNEDEIWTGEINMKKAWESADYKDLIVCADFGMELNQRFETLLIYSIHK